MNKLDLFLPNFHKKHELLAREYLSTNKTQLLLFIFCVEAFIRMLWTHVKDIYIFSLNKSKTLTQLKY